MWWPAKAWRCTWSRQTVQMRLPVLQFVKAVQGTATPPAVCLAGIRLRCPDPGVRCATTPNTYACVYFLATHVRVRLEICRDLQELKHHFVCASWMLLAARSYLRLSDAQMMRVRGILPSIVCTICMQHIRAIFEPYGSRERKLKHSCTTWLARGTWRLQCVLAPERSTL